MESRWKEFCANTISKEELIPALLSCSIAAFQGRRTEAEKEAKQLVWKYKVQFAGLGHIRQIKVGKFREKKPKVDRIINESILIF